MEWVYLGHAMWLARIGGLRLLFDPLLDDALRGDVSHTCPRRRIDAAALRPDLIVVSHAHPDHFDLPSLARLARCAPEAPVITADPLVARSARRLGFSTTAVVKPWQPVDLSPLQLLPTPSAARVPEWGMVVVHPDGVVWNQVDAVVPDAEGARSQAAEVRARTGRAIDLVLARGQPVKEIDVQTCGSLGFPFGAYGRLLACIEAVEPGCVVPAASGLAMRPPADWLNRISYPVDPTVLLRDLAAAGVRTLPGVLGGRYRVEGGAVELTGERAGELLAWIGPEPDRTFRPLVIPDVADPDRGDSAAHRRAVDAWLAEELEPALARAAATLGDVRLVLALEVVYADGTERQTWAVGGGVRRVEDEPWDLLNVVAGSLLADVIAGRRSWGEVLLPGHLRSVDRACRWRNGRLERIRVPVVFLYLALPYAESVERWVEAELQRLEA